MAAPSSGSKSIWLRPTEWFSCRQVLGMMVFLGFIFNYMLRVNLSIAIVAMVKSSHNKSSKYYSGGSSECVVEAAPVYNNVSGEMYNSSHHSDSEYEGLQFEWDEYTQGLILGCFFWGYIFTELPGGRLAEIFGARRVFGYSMLASSILTMLTPLAARLSYIAVIILRVLLGVFLGATWPSIHPMIAIWIPPMERSKFIANMMASSLGVAITFPVCGYIIASIGWEAVFYITGAVAIAWSLSWIFLVHDSPAQHPRISEEERRYIETAIGGTTKKGKPLRVPWRKILTAPCVWAIIVVHATSVFGYFTVITQGPTFMKSILRFNIKENGLLSSLPYLGKYIFAVSTSHLADFLRSSGKLSTTVTRKLFTAFAVILPSLLMLTQVFLGCDRIAAVTIFTLALSVNGAVTAGYLGNGLDIAPNFSGTIFGMANTLSSTGGFLASFMVGVLTNNNQTFGQWRKVFGILTAVYGTGGITYLIFGTGELQPWNSPKNIDGEAVKEGDEDVEMISEKTKT